MLGLWDGMRGSVQTYSGKTGVLQGLLQQTQALIVDEKVNRFSRPRTITGPEGRFYRLPVPHP